MAFLAQGWSVFLFLCFYAANIVSFVISGPQARKRRHKHFRALRIRRPPARRCTLY